MSCAEQRLWGSLCCKGNMWRRGFFWRPKNETGKRFFRCSFIRNGFFARLSYCCVSWSWASTLLEFLFHYPCWCYMNCLFDFARDAIRVTINKLYFVPEWFASGFVSMLVPEWFASGFVSMLWIGWDLGTGESDVSIVLFNSALRRSSSPSDVHLAAFSGNPVNYAILFSRVDSVFWSY